MTNFTADGTTRRQLIADWCNVDNEGNIKTSALTTLEAIQDNYGRVPDQLVRLANWFDDELDKLPNLPAETTHWYHVVERELCRAVDALEGDFQGYLHQIFENLTLEGQYNGEPIGFETEINS